MKKIMLGISVVMVLLTLFSPYGILATASNFFKINSELNELENLKASNIELREEYIKAKNNFDSKRVFEVHYSDVSSLKKVLESIPSVEIRSINSCDADKSYLVGAEWSETSNANAVKLTLYSKDKASLLNIINKLELPVRNVYLTVNGELEVLFLTGGGSNV